VDFGRRVEQRKAEALRVVYLLPFERGIAGINPWGKKEKRRSKPKTRHRSPSTRRLEQTNMKHIPPREKKKTRRRISKKAGVRYRQWRVLAGKREGKKGLPMLSQEGER